MFQKWCLLRCTDLLALALAAVMAYPAFAAEAPAVKKTASKKATALPEILQEIEKKYADAGTLAAKFTQVTESATLKSKKKETGMIMAKRPDKVRWETVSPDANLLISDGKRFWFYTPPFEEGERGQVIERKASEVQSRVANALLSGSFSSVGKVQPKGKSGSEFTLTFRPGTAGTVQKAEIHVNPEKKLIEKVVLEHRGGNRAEISLTDIELGRKIPDEGFRFVAPPNTDKVTE